MKTLFGFAFLLTTSISYSQNWIDASKASSAQEAGMRIINGGAVSYYLYSDNGTNDFNIQSTAVSGEHDAFPRLRLPFASPNIYLGLSGGNVGIGTTSPGAKLDIAANNGYELKFSGDNGNIWGTNSLYFLANDDIYLGSGGVDAQVALKGGNFGVGNSNPSAKLHISNGDVLLQNSSSGYPSLYLKDVAGSNVLKFDYNSLIHSGGVFYIRSGGSSNLIINDGSNGGNVGIGTQTPDAKLSVNGTVHAKEVKVDLTGWPDYVFAMDYNLQPLEEVKVFIDQNQRLPEMPSATEVETNGVMLGEMNKLLLKKVEELTLYLIEMKKENMDLKTRLEKLELESKN